MGSGQTLRGLKFIIFLCIFWRSVPETQSAHEWNLELVSGADLWLQSALFFEPGPFPGLPGPTVGLKWGKNPGPDLSFDLP